MKESFSRSWVRLESGCPLARPIAEVAVRSTRHCAPITAVSRHVDVIFTLMRKLMNHQYKSAPSVWWLNRCHLQRPPVPTSVPATFARWNLEEFLHCTKLWLHHCKMNWGIADFFCLRKHCKKSKEVRDRFTITAGYSCRWLHFLSPVGGQQRSVSLIDLLAVSDPADWQLMLSGSFVSVDC